MDRKKRKRYTNAQVAEALLSIRQGMSIYKASRQYNVPETTLRSKRDELYENERCGKQPVLNLNEERQIVDWIHYLGKCGFPVTKDQLLHTVSKLVENLQRPNPFKDGVPGKKWFLGFMQRHPAVSKRVSQNLPTSRNQVTETALRAWFDRVESYFKENDMLQVFQDPKRIFNCDESGFFLCPKDKQVLVKKGSKRVYNRVANDEKECLTVLVNVSADGNVAPPMVLFPYKRLPNNIKSTVPSWWGVGNTESGWMNMESFYEYVANVFYPWLRQQEITLPAVLFLDGHTSHISLPLTTFCKEKGIVLVALLPNSTHVLQPLDVAVFRPVKGTWRDIVREFRVNNNYGKLKRTDFSREVQKCFDRSLKPETIKSGFKCCGLYPFDKQNIDYDKLLSKVKKHQDKLSEANQNTLLNTQQMISMRNYKDSNAQFKKQFESRLSQDTLKSFKEAGNQWTGDPTYEKLFLFWISLTSSESIFEDQADSVLNIGETTFTNNVDENVLNFDIRSDRILTPLIDKEANNIETTILESTQLSLSSIYAIPTTDKPFEANSLLPTPYLADSPILIKIIDPNLLSEVTPPQKIRIVTEENAPQILRSSTPQLSNAPSHSEIENADLEVDCSSSLTRQPNRTQKEPLTDNQNSKEIDTLVMPGTSKTQTPTVIENATPPTPFKGIHTPFKNAFFFPKTENVPKTKKVTKKVTPTVATAAEFIEHQRR
ncbi:uncharacterized protein LOC132903545 [Amyelois transitella]|nr:uncharacterized protein LOC132903545 [Amyelois transitella]